MSKWPVITVGDYVTQQDEKVSIDPAVEYNTMGVRWYGRGAYMRPPAKPQTKRLNVAHEGDFTFCRIDIHKGPFAVVPAELDGALATNEFPLYTTDKHLDVNFLRLCFLDQNTLARIGRDRDGRDGRARWKGPDFEAQQIPLPPLSVQRRIVQVMASLDEALAATDDEADKLAEVLLARREALTNDESHPLVRADTAFDIRLGRQRSPQRATGPSMTKYLRSGNVGHDELRLDDVFEMDFNAKERETFALVDGDVLVSEGSAGAGAVGMPAAWSGELGAPVCFQNTLLRYRAKAGITSPEFVRHWCLWAYESGAFRHTAPPGVNILHIGSTRAKAMMIRLPDPSQQDSVVAELEPLTGAVASLRQEANRLRAARTALLDALLTRKIEVTTIDIDAESADLA